MTEPIYADWQTLIDAGESLTPAEAKAIFQTLLDRDKKIQQLEDEAYAMYNGWRKGFDVSGPMNAFRQGHQAMLYLNGSKYAFRCHCGCNVFFKGRDDEGPYYECNSCNDQYREDKGEN